MSVKFIASKNGNLFEQSKQAGLYYVTVEEVLSYATPEEEEEERLYNHGRIPTRTANIFRTMKEFNEIFATMNIEPKIGLEIGGKVVVKEQLRPFNMIDPYDSVKCPGDKAKAQGLMCTVKGKPIYRSTLYTADETMEDILEVHDNRRQIAIFYAGQANGWGQESSRVLLNLTINAYTKIAIPAIRENATFYPRLVIELQAILANHKYGCDKEETMLYLKRLIKEVEEYEGLPF